jgi:hypothetical protein
VIAYRHTHKSTNQSGDDPYGQQRSSTGCHRKGARSSASDGLTHAVKRTATNKSTVRRSSTRSAGLRKKADWQRGSDAGSAIAESITIGK